MQKAQYFLFLNIKKRTMKKIVWAIAGLTFIVSCQKPPKGGNLGRLKLDEKVERYSEDHQSAEDHHAISENHDAEKESQKVTKKDSSAIHIVKDSVKSEH